MITESEKIVVHLELSRKSAALLYALNRHALKLPRIIDPDDEVDVIDAEGTFATAGVPEALRAAFVDKCVDSPLLSFTEAEFDELTRELGTTLWDALH